VISRITPTAYGHPPVASADAENNLSTGVVRAIGDTHTHDVLVAAIAGLLLADLLEGKSNQNYGAVYTAMLRHPERFKKVGPGEFRLVDEEEEASSGASA